MNRVTVETTIARPREEVYDYLVDISNMSEYTDHFLSGWHLTRENPRGKGAGVRFRIGAPLNRFDWSDLTFVEAERPHRIVARGRGGKMNRIRSLSTLTITQATKGTTKVQWTFETVPSKPSDRLLEIVGGRRWWKRRMSRSVGRLKKILEQDRARGQRVTVAGG